MNEGCGGSWDNVKGWRKKVAAHEREHENEYNICLASDTTTAIMSRMESIVGDKSSTVTDEMWKIWDPFYREVVVAVHPAYAGANDTGNAIFWWYVGEWKHERIRRPPHGNRSNC